MRPSSPAPGPSQAGCRVMDSGSRIPTPSRRSATPLPKHGPDRSLYQMLLGADWNLLPQAVRSMHLRGDVLEATGTVRVARGKHPAARLLANAIGMPRESDACQTRL